MRLLKQPSRVSCFPTALAMVLDLSVEEVMGWAGHSGTAFCFDQFVGFHPQEFVFKALKAGRALVFIEATPKSVVKTYDNYNTKYIKELMSTMDMVLVGYTEKGNAHAIAWSHAAQMVFDPEGEIYPFGNFSISYALVVGC